MINAKTNTVIQFILEDIEEHHSIKYRDDIGDSMLEKIYSRYGKDFSREKILFIIKTSMFFWGVDDLVVVTEDKILFTNDKSRPVISYADVDRIVFREDTVSDNFIRVYNKYNRMIEMKYPGIDRVQAASLMYAMKELRKGTSSIHIMSNIKGLNKKYLMRSSRFHDFYREVGYSAFIYGVFPTFDYVECFFDVDVVADRMERAGNVGSTTSAVLSGIANAVERKKEEMRRAQEREARRHR